jgi:hypothetical protein
VEVTALVPAPSESPTALWAQRRDEPSELYAHFREWLRLTPRPTPAQCNAVELAAQFDWVARAQAYDTACDLLLEVPSGSLKDHWQSTVNAWGQMIDIEAKKLLRQSMSSRTPVVGSQEQLGWIRQVADIQIALREQQAGDEAYNPERLTPEEQVQLDELLTKMRTR